MSALSIDSAEEFLEICNRQLVNEKSGLIQVTYRTLKRHESYIKYLEERLVAAENVITTAKESHVMEGKSTTTKLCFDVREYLKNHPKMFKVDV